MAPQDTTITHYLDRFAQPLEGADWPFGAARFDHVVVVPAFAESADFIHEALARHGDTSWLLIVVVNAPTQASMADVERTRSLLYASLSPLLICATNPAGRAWQDAPRKRAVWLVDRVSRERRLDPKGGVGLARKIGMDLALRAIACGQIDTPAIWCCDGDGVWPDNYFRPRMSKNESALTFAFRHVGPAADSAAQRVYDLRLRDYPAQLRAAGSPYAFLALGSAMVVSARHYAQVRGCPRRAAGEDFHLLAKLAKVGTIRTCQEITVSLEARASRRVPFGTGQGVAALERGGDPRDAPVFYASRSFRVLDALLRRSSQWLEQPPADGDEALVRALCVRCLVDADVDGVPVDVLQPALLWRALQRAVAASTSEVTRKRHFHTYFDALRTLRLIHRLRDAGLANMSERELERFEPERLALATSTTGLSRG